MNGKLSPPTFRPDRRFPAPWLPKPGAALASAPPKSVSELTGSGGSRFAGASAVVTGPPMVGAGGCNGAVGPPDVVRDDVKAPPDDENDVFGALNTKSVPALVRSVALRWKELPKSLSDF